MLKKKLREMIAQYNTVAASEHGIDAEAVCSLSDDVVLPWEAQGDGKQNVFYIMTCDSSHQSKISQPHNH